MFFLVSVVLKIIQPYGCVHLALWNVLVPLAIILVTLVARIASKKLSSEEDIIVVIYST